MRVAGVAIVMLVAALMLWWSRDAAPALRPAGPASPTEARAAAVSVTGPAAGVAPAEREVVEAAAAAAAARAPRRDGPPRQTLRGRVLHDTGVPARGARVHAGDRATTAEADGTFALELDGADDELTAWLVGYEPASVADVRMLPDVIAGRPIDVVLPGKALAIDGWLVNADGTPGAGWHVHLHGGVTIVEDLEEPAVCAEDLANGTAQLQDAVTRRPPFANARPPLLGADGAFALGGLRRDRDYVLRAWHATTLQVALSPPLRAGTRGYRFVVPLASFREQVRGRAIDRHGGGIAGVYVSVTICLRDAANRALYQTGQQVLTDRDGAFALVRVIREDLVLSFDGDAVVSTLHDLRATDPGDGLLVRLALLCQFRFEADPGAVAPTSLRVLDAQRQPLPVRSGISALREGRQRLPWPVYSEHVIEVSDEAAWLVLEVDEREVRRVPLLLTRDGCPVVRG